MIHLLFSALYKSKLRIVTAITTTGLLISAACLLSSCTTPPSCQSILSALKPTLKPPKPLVTREEKPSPSRYFKPADAEIGTGRYMVKTTAYSHAESDSLKYGRLSASGTALRSKGDIRSAAADWSRYPVGTKFRIVGASQIYEIDDYGGGLVGTDTIDIYQPTLTAMRNWGSPELGVEILEWGSIKRSMEILEKRVRVPHVKQMWLNLQAKCQAVPDELQDGFRVTEAKITVQLDQQLHVPDPCSQVFVQQFRDCLRQHW